MVAVIAEQAAQKLELKLMTNHMRRLHGQMNLQKEKCGRESAAWLSDSETELTTASPQNGPRTIISSSSSGNLVDAESDAARIVVLRSDATEQDWQGDTQETRSCPDHFHLRTPPDP